MHEAFHLFKEIILVQFTIVVIYCLFMFFSFNTGTFGSVKVEIGEGYGSIVPNRLGVEAHKLTADFV